MSDQIHVFAGAERDASGIGVNHLRVSVDLLVNTGLWANLDVRPQTTLSEGIRKILIELESNLSSGILAACVCSER